MPKTIPEGLHQGNAYSEATEAGGLVFIAGQVAKDTSGGFDAEARRAFEAVGHQLEHVGLGYADVVRCTVFLRNWEDFGAMNAIFKEVFPTDPPARTTVGVTALARDCTIELEVTAAR